MSTKIEKIIKLYNMQTHNAKRIVERLDNHLPYAYINEVIKRYHTAHSKTIKSQYVRDIKRLKIKNAIVLAIIIEIAIENEKNCKKLERMATKKIINH